MKSNKIKIVDVRDGGKNYLINNHIKKIYLKKEVEIITISETKHNLVWNIKNEEIQPYGMVGDAFKYYTHATNNKQWYDSTKAIYAEYEIGYQPLLLLRTPVVPFDETCSDCPVLLRLESI